MGTFMQPWWSAVAAEQNNTRASTQLANSLEQRVTEFTLPNGLHFIVLRRAEAPIVSCHTYANVGAFDEVDGQTGIAHLLEHMAFKGTPVVGSKDYAREAPLLRSLDEVFYELRAARASGSPSASVNRLQDKLKTLQVQAQDLEVPDAFGSLLRAEGAVGLNATTSHDCTRYFVSLPSNKLELWFALEAQRFQFPVFRQLYSEKQVVAEERRMRIDNSPNGRFQAQFAEAALSNNYRRPVIGYPQDVEALGRQELQQFFSTYYGPGNLAMSIVGDVDPDQVYKLAVRYFGSWDPSGYVVLPSPANGMSSSSSSESLPQPAAFVAGQQREFTQAAVSGPTTLLGYYRPPLTTSEGIVLEVISDLLSAGRTSRMTRNIVLQQQALAANVVPSYPGQKHAGLVLVYGVPFSTDDVYSMEVLLKQQLRQLVEDGVSVQELDKVKRASLTGLYDVVQSNSSLAAALCGYHVNTGGWRGLLGELEFVQGLGVEEVVGVAGKTFRDDNCFAGYMLPLKA